MSDSGMLKMPASPESGYVDKGMSPMSAVLSPGSPHGSKGIAFHNRGRNIKNNNNNPFPALSPERKATIESFGKIRDPHNLNYSFNETGPAPLEFSK